MHHISDACVASFTSLWATNKRAATFYFILSCMNVMKIPNKPTFASAAQDWTLHLLSTRLCGDQLLRDAQTHGLQLLRPVSYVMFVCLDAHQINGGLTRNFRPICHTRTHTARWTQHPRMCIFLPGCLLGNSNAQLEMAHSCAERWKTNQTMFSANYVVQKQKRNKENKELNKNLEDSSHSNINITIPS